MSGAQTLLTVANMQPKGKMQPASYAELINAKNRIISGTIDETSQPAYHAGNQNNEKRKNAHIGADK